MKEQQRKAALKKRHEGNREKKKKGGRSGPIVFWRFGVLSFFFSGVFDNFERFLVVFRQFMYVLWLGVFILGLTIGKLVLERNIFRNIVWIPIDIGTNWFWIVSDHIETDRIGTT